MLFRSRLADASGVTVSSFTGQVRAALASGTGTLSGTTAVSAVSGVATFTDLRVTGAGQVSLSFSSDADIAPVNSEPFAVSAITPQTARMEMVTQPLGGVSGSLLGRQPEVRRVDANGNVVLTPVTVNDVVRVTLNGAGGTLTGAPGVAFPSATGVFAFTDLGVTGAGTYTLTFTSGSLTAVTSAPITIAASSATRLVVSRQPVGATSGALLATDRKSVV